MSTPTIVRKVSNLANNNNTDNTNSPTTTSSPPIRPTRVVRVLSKSAALASTGTTTDNASTTTPTTQQQQPTTSTVDHPPPTTTNSIEHNDTPDNASSTESNGTTTKKVIKRVIVRRPAGEAASNSTATTTTTTTSDNNTINNNNNTNTSQTPPVNNINNTITPITTTNNNTTTTTASTKEPTTQPSSTTKETTTNNEVNTTTSTPITPRSNVADRWLKNNTAATTITTEQPPTPVRRVINRNSLKQEDKQNTPVIVPSTTPTPTTTTPTPSTENKNINSTSSQFGTKLVSAANKSHSTIDTTTSTPAVVNGSPHQTSKSMNDVPETKSVKDLITKLTPNLKVFTPEQLMNDKKSVGGSDNIRPLRPLEIATWYGGSVSVATEDPKFDNSSIEDLKKEAPDVYYTNYLFNPLFDEQSACDTPTINMSAQEILQYNFVVELMRKKHTNLLTLDPIVFEEEMKNASSLSSLTLSRTLSSTHTRTDSVTSSTEDVLSREDIGYPINKCSKNWKYQLKKKKENAKNNFNPNDGMFTPRASVQLQSSSPSSPATLNSTPVNPLYDHLYYMPCWKHQLQIDQIVKRGGDQKKVQ